MVDPAYVNEGYKDLPDDHEIGNSGTVLRQHKGGTAKKLALEDEPKGFWSRVADHVQLTMPVCKFLRRHDSSAPAFGKVYHGWFEMGEHLEKPSAISYSATASEKHASRWAYSHAAIFAAGYVVDPEFIQ